MLRGVLVPMVALRNYLTTHKPVYVFKVLKHALKLWYQLCITYILWCTFTDGNWRYPVS